MLSAEELEARRTALEAELGEPITDDGLTATGTSVAVGQVAPMERAASAQGLLGACGTLMGGLSAVTAGWSYDRFGRTTTYTAATLCMLTLIAGGAYLAGPTHFRRETLSAEPLELELTR